MLLQLISNMLVSIITCSNDACTCTCTVARVLCFRWIHLYYYYSIYIINHRDGEIKDTDGNNMHEDTLNNAHTHYKSKNLNDIIL